MIPARMSPSGLAPLALADRFLARQGVDPGLGRVLADLFIQAGIPPIESGPLAGGSPSSAGLPDPTERALEWEVLEADLAGWVPRTKSAG